MKELSQEYLLGGALQKDGWEFPVLVKLQSG